MDPSPENTKGRPKTAMDGGVALGLAAAEGAIRLAQKGLRERLPRPLRRGGATKWIGGMPCGVVLAWGGVMHDQALGVIGTLGFGAVAGLRGIACGGLLGLAEDLVLGRPLAALLRLFGNYHQ